MRSAVEELDGDGAPDRSWNWKMPPWPVVVKSGRGVACWTPMERKSTAELLEAWRDATRAAELVADRAAKAAERAANTARDAAKRAAQLARSSRDKNVSGGDRAKAAHAAEDLARYAYHARVADAERRQSNERS